MKLWKPLSMRKVHQSLINAVKGLYEAQKQPNAAGLTMEAARSTILLGIWQELRLIRWVMVLGLAAYLILH